MNKKELIDRLLTTASEIIATDSDDNQKAVASILYAVVGAMHANKEITICNAVASIVQNELMPAIMQGIDDRKAQQN